MEIVTLAHVTLYRPGSASGRGFTQHNPVAKIFEVRDDRLATLREAVENYAEAQGEQRDYLQAMRQVPTMHYTPQTPDAVVFDVHTPNIQYSTPYAACVAYPALKAGDRYFKLEQVALD